MAETRLGFLLIWTCFLIYSARCSVPESKLNPSIKEQQVETSHRIDSLNILIFIILLILNVLTIWLFKHRRFRFVHETGLAIIYGLIVGAIIRYTSHADVKKLVRFGTTYIGELPDSVYLNVTQNQTREIYYKCDKKTRAAIEGDTQELEKKATFDPEVFFNVLLPPIIFYAGYSMKRRHFFRNFGAIMTYAFIGTIISCIVVGAILFGLTRLMPYLNMSLNDCLIFGAFISATDPVTVLAIFGELNVDVDLYALVFGESVLNDAVAIVMAGAIETYGTAAGSNTGFDGLAVLKAVGNFLGIFGGAFALGSAMGCFTALLTKYTKVHEYPLLETSLFFLMSYGTFLAAEAAEMTGIVAVLFCGICQAHYTYNNLSVESRARTKQLFEVLNFLAENFVFTYIGVSTFTFQSHKWDGGFIASSFLAVVVARACNIYPLSFLLNLGRSNKIRYNFQHMMMFSGLRGAIAFALAIRDTSRDQRRTIFTTTLLIVIATVILCGGFTTQMLQWLKIRVGVEEETEMQNFEAVRTAMTRQKKYQTMEESSGAGPSVTAASHPRSTIPGGSPSEPQPPEQPTRVYEKAWLVLKWYNIDSKYVKPLLTHARPPLTETLPKCCLPLAKFLTTEKQLTSTEGLPRQSEESDTDLIIDEHELSYGEQNSASYPDNSAKPHSNSTSQHADNQFEVQNI